MVLECAAVYAPAVASAKAGGFDVLACPRCGGRLRLIALIEQGAVIARPPPSPARSPPAIGPVDAADGWDEVVVS